MGHAKRLVVGRDVVKVAVMLMRVKLLLGDTALRVTQRCDLLPAAPINVDIQRLLSDRLVAVAHVTHLLLVDSVQYFLLPCEVGIRA